MRRSAPVLVLLTLSLSSCAAPDSGSSVRTGLAGERALSSLDDAEIERACDGWVTYAARELAAVDGPQGILCAISSARDSADAASCETAYAECLALAPRLDTLCATGSSPVPACDPSVTVERYEECMTISVDAMAVLGIDCSLAGRDGELDARLEAWTTPAGCEPLNMRSCAPFAPAEP